MSKPGNAANHHSRRLNFRFYMRNKKIKIICATSRVIFRPLPFPKRPHFLRLLPPLERVKYFTHGRETFITRHSVIQRRSDLIIPRMRAGIAEAKESILESKPRALLMSALQIGHSLHLELLSLSPIQPQR